MPVFVQTAALFHMSWNDQHSLKKGGTHTGTKETDKVDFLIKEKDKIYVCGGIKYYCNYAIIGTIDTQHG